MIVLCGNINTEAEVYNSAFRQGIKLTVCCLNTAPQMVDIIAPLTPARKEMPPIDLTLAVNYIPAVVCLGKATLISFCLSVLHPGTHLGGFIIFAMLLNIDRSIACARIFDENALQLCILASWVINYLRAANEAPALLNPIASGLWVAFSLCLVVEPKAVQEAFVLYGQGAGGTFSKLIPAVATSLFIGVLSYTPLAAESGVVKSSRTVIFAALCVAWVYVVNVWRSKPRQQMGSCVFETHALIARICPLLFVNCLVAGGFAALCVAGIVYHYVRIHVSKLCSNNRLEAVTVEVARPEIPVTVDLYQQDMPVIEEEDDEQLEAYFRSACQNRRGEVG